MENTMKKSNEIKQITAKEAKAISDIKLDIIKAVNEEIYFACSSGYGGVSIYKDMIPDFYEVNRFLERYYEDHGFTYNQGTQYLYFWIIWDTDKETYYPKERGKDKNCDDKVN
jgi:hypothetical protein